MSVLQITVIWRGNLHYELITIGKFQKLSWYWSSLSRSKCLHKQDLSGGSYSSHRFFGFKIAAQSQDSTGNFITWTLVRKEPFLVIRRKILWNLWIVIITVNLMKQNLYPQMFLWENTCMKPNPATTVCRGRDPVLLVSTFWIFVYSDVQIYFDPFISDKTSAWCLEVTKQKR